MVADADRISCSSRRQSQEEELFNAISHGLGALLSIAGLALLLIRSARHGGTIHVVSVTIFGASMILLYLVSCLYHALPESRGKQVFQILDHCSIFVLIMGSYAPFCLVTVGGMLGCTVFLINIVSGMVGILLNAVSFHRWKRLSQVLYLVMGWMGVLMISAVFRNLSHFSFVLLMLGGVSYTVGVFLYRRKDKKYWHGIWHVFVLLGSVLHFLVIYSSCCF